MATQRRSIKELWTFLRYNPLRRRRDLAERMRARRPSILGWLAIALFSPVIWALLLDLWSSDDITVTRGESGGTRTETDLTAFFSQDVQALVLVTWVACGVGAIVTATQWDVDREPLTEHGWQYRHGKSSVTPHRFTAFPLASLEPRKVSSFAWTADHGRVASAYTVWVSRTHRYSVEQVELPWLLPGVAVVPTKLYDKLAATVGGQDVSYESAAFNERWRVLSNDHQFSSALLHPGMIERLLQDDLDNMAFSFDGAAITSWWPGRTPVEQVEHRVSVIGHLADLIPDFAAKQFGAERPDAWGAATFQPSAPAPTVESDPDHWEIQPRLDDGLGTQTFHP